MKNCAQCKSQFEITAEDRRFYESVSPEFNGKKYLIPEPTLCPDCRHQRRLAFRNERNLYHRKSDMSGKQMVAMYSPDKPYKVYTQEEWWSDAWDARDYGMEFDFSRPFFEQFNELFLKVPRIALINKEHENSEYCNFAIGNKNSYLMFGCANCQDSFYCSRVLDSKDLIDCMNVIGSEICYECVDCEKCYNSKWLQACSICHDCEFGFDLRNCRHCFACVGLRGEEYCIGNVQMPKDEYMKTLNSLRKNPANILRRFQEHKKQLIRKSYNGQNTENSTGDNIFNAKNCYSCFSVNTIEDCKYICDATHMRSSYDVNNDDHSELVYEVIGSETNYHCIFHDICWFGSEIMYSSLCFHSKNLFGCVGLRKNEYCILNRKYTKPEYEKLVPKIIEHMKKTGEWGEFFPASISPFGYNETLAADYFPLAKTEAEKLEWKWYEDTESELYKGSVYKIPADIKDVDDEITKSILICEKTKKPYKIIPQELEFCREHGIPIPRQCPDERHRVRMNLRNPRKLFSRACAKCGTGIQTTYSSDRPEKVYCEKCYLKEVY
jgi:hypothetical protein